MFKNQILVFSLIGRETIPLKRCVLIGCHISTKLPVKKSARRKQMADTKRGFSEDEFSTALAEALRYFKYDSLKEEQIECIRRVICLREDVLAVLPTGFGKNLIYQVSFLCMCIRVEDCVSGLKLNLQIVKCSRSWLSKYPLVRDKESNN